jgi:hypothetical protein
MRFIVGFVVVVGSSHFLDLPQNPLGLDEAGIARATPPRTVKARVACFTVFSAVAWVFWTAWSSSMPPWSEIEC